MPLKGVALTVQYVAWDTGANAGKTGDAANHTLRLIKDGAAASPANSPSEVDAANCPGVYKLALTAAEMNYGVITLAGKSSTSGVVIVPVTLTTEGGNLDAPVSTRAPESGGNLAAVKAKTDNLPADPADESKVQGHVADALAAYDPPTKAELDSAVSPLALEANVQGQVAAALAAYDPPTKAEMDAALAALNNLSVGDLLAGDISDSLSFPANSLADRLRKLFWILCNRMIITDASGAFTAYQGDGITPGATGTIVDNGTNTVRSAPTWP
jgi:hypothetical protein